MASVKRVDDLENRMVMALVAADFDRTIIEVAASVCVEIARQYCEELHLERVGVLPGR
jgi:hypothetical protein